MSYKVNSSKVESSRNLVLKISTYISIKKNIISKSNKTKLPKKVSLMLKMLSNKLQPKASNKSNKKLTKWLVLHKESFRMTKIKRIPKMFTMRNQNLNRLNKNYFQSNGILII